MYPHLGLEENNLHEFISECCYASLSVEPLCTLTCTNCGKESKFPHQLIPNPHNLIIIDKDLLSVTKGIIVHQCNTQGKMGAGLALKIRRKYPKAFERYLYMCEKKLFKLGMIHIVWINKDLMICNLAGQERYGRAKRYTDYEAVETALTKLNYTIDRKYWKIFLPFNMGCTLAGGDWNIVSEIISKTVPDAIICNYA